MLGSTLRFSAGSRPYIPRTHRLSDAPLRHGHGHGRHHESRHRASAAASGSNSVGVVIVDHGSRKAESNDMLFEFVELYKASTGTAVVEAAHMEIAEPTIEQAIGEACMHRFTHWGARQPFLLHAPLHGVKQVCLLVYACTRCDITVRLLMTRGRCHMTHRMTLHVAEAVENLPLPDLP